MASLLLVAGVLGVAAMLSSGCSTAGRVLFTADPATQRTTDSPRPLDLMGDPSGRPAPGRLPSTGGIDQDGVHGVWVAGRDGEQPRRVSGTRTALLPRWSPDGTRLMFLARETKRGTAWNIWIADPETATARKVTSSGVVSLAGAAWFPDSQRICYGSGNWLVVADTEDNATRSFRLPNESSRIVGVPAVSPDGRRVAFAVDGEGAWMVSLADGGVRQIVAEQDVDAFAWSPGGRQIAFRTGRDGQWKVRVVK
jgi:Tol biopolymer transport system component